MVYVLSCRSTWRFIVLACCCVGLAAADLHVASIGDDAADGSQASPLATVAEGLSRAGNGDRVLLRRGDTFAVDDLSLGNGVTLGAYGAGPRPVLSGAATITAWEDLGGGRYRAAVPECVRLWDDSDHLPRARHPDNGWLRTASGTTADLLLLEGVGDPAGSWTGATVRWRRWSWWYETRTVAEDAGGGDLTLAPRDFSAPNNVGIGSGCYLEAERALDAPGEWWFADGWLTLQAPAGGAPTAAGFHPVAVDRALTLGGGSVLQDVAIRHYIGSGGALRITGPATVSGCLIEGIAFTGIAGVWNAFGSTISGCQFRDIHGNAVTWNENFSSAGGTVISDNRFDRIGVVPGLGGNGSWKASGVVITNGSESGAGVVVRRNRFADIGYCGVILGSDNQVVEHNVFHRCLSTHNDGAAVYTNSNGNTIHENIIIDSVGDTSSSQPWTPLGHGIWPEFLSDFADHVITGNTVYGCAGHGLFLPNNFTATVHDNIFLSNRRAGIDLSGRGDAAVDLDQGNDLQDNVAGIGARPYSTDRSETLADWNMYSDFDRCLQYALPDPDKSRGDYDYGSMSGTTFVRPEAALPLLTAGNSERDVATWQSEEADWADPDPSVVTAAVFLFINDTDSDRDMALPAGDWTDLDGVALSGTVAVPAWRSVPLILTSADDGTLPGYRLASEHGRAIRIRSDRASDWVIGVADGPVTGTPSAVAGDGTHLFENLAATRSHRLAPTGSEPLGDG